MFRFNKKYCLCLRPKKTRKDKLFNHATGKLIQEIDLLEILKKLRVYQFASQ